MDFLSLLQGSDLDEDAYQRVLNTLQQHADKNFVQRLIKPSEYPVLDMGGGNYGTHLMSYATGDQGAMVYPMIVQKPGSSNLEQLSPTEAINHALKTGEFIPFKTPEEADWFGKNYKRIWGLRHSAPQMGDPIALP